MIRVTYTVDLPEWWGADECYDDCGKDAVVELMHEDIAAFLENGSWSVQKINMESKTMRKIARNILHPNNGVLPGQQIRDLCLQLQMINPFSERVVEPISGFSAGLSSASYDLTLRDALVLKPGDFSLAVAQETLSIPDDICCMVHDKSSNARLGIVVQNTFVDPGFIGDLVLELTNHSCKEFYLHPGYPIAQLVFHWLAEPAERPYSGKYQGQRGIVEALREPKKDQ